MKVHALDDIVWFTSCITTAMSLNTNRLLYKYSVCFVCIFDFTLVHAFNYISAYWLHFVARRRAVLTRYTAVPKATRARPHSASKMVPA